MLIKAVLVFLLVMAGIAMLGNALFPGALARRIKWRLAPCPDCGKRGCACGGR